MDATCIKIVGGMGTAIAALVVVIRILWAKIAEERGAAERAKAEIIELHRKRIEELEAFRKMVESKGQKP